MFIDSTIIPIDISQKIVLSHSVWIHLCCWSLTTDSHCLDWTGHVFQDKVQSEIGQEVQSQEYHGLNKYADRSKNYFAATSGLFVLVGFLPFIKFIFTLFVSSDFFG